MKFTFTFSGLATALFISRLFKTQSMDLFDRENELEINMKEMSLSEEFDLANFLEDIVLNNEEMSLLNELDSENFSEDIFVNNKESYLLEPITAELDSTRTVEAEPFDPTRVVPSESARTMTSSDARLSVSKGALLMSAGLVAMGLFGGSKPSTQSSDENKNDMQTLSLN